MNYSMWMFSLYLCIFPCKRACSVRVPWVHFWQVDMKMWRSFCLPIAAPQFAGKQPHTGQSGGGVGHAGLRHYQWQNQTASRTTDQDSGWLVGVYVHISLVHLQAENVAMQPFSCTSLQNVQFRMAASSTIIDFFVPFVWDVKQSLLCWRHYPLCA